MLGIDVGSGVGGAVDDAAEEHREEHEVVVLHPDHAILAELGADSLCKFEVNVTVGKPVCLVKVHLAGVVVEEGPEDRVGETVVVLVGDVVCEIDGLARVLVHQPLVDEWPILGRDVKAGPSDPGEGE